jgi:hypothetical protein
VGLFNPFVKWCDDVGIMAMVLAFLIYIAKRKHKKSTKKYCFLYYRMIRYTCFYIFIIFFMEKAKNWRVYKVEDTYSGYCSLSCWREGAPKQNGNYQSYQYREELVGELSAHTPMELWEGCMLPVELMQDAHLRKKTLLLISDRAGHEYREEAVRLLYRGAQEGKWKHKAYSFAGYGPHGHQSSKSRECKLYERIVCSGTLKNYDEDVQEIIRQTVGKRLRGKKYRHLMFPSA